ncbi:MAG: D-alanine--D-alanine ligase, partial [Bacteroidota bacterium]|nr:D-alanine--D-alanine ligase [Bacteroidota bacterium]
REFNLSILGGKQGPQVMPPAEILFKDYPEGKPRIVGYNAKWTENSFEYNHTPRTFRFKKEDAPLLEELKKIALQCWQSFGLKGYVRVDFRVDRNKKPHVLEINGNPCIAPESGYVAATKQAGLKFQEVIQRIIEDALN